MQNKKTNVKNEVKHWWLKEIKFCGTNIAVQEQE